jgi:hypothetical protein
VFLRWEMIKRHVMLVETIIVVTENIIYYVFLARIALSSKDFKTLFSTFSYG